MSTLRDDLAPFLTRYEALVAEVDGVFDRVKAQHADLVACKTGCSDCCHALFDLTLVEAVYLNQKFTDTFSQEVKNAIQEEADEADRKAYKLKHKIFKASEEGVPSSELLAEVARMRVRCPLLDKDETCRLYDSRPITCRLYGIPTQVGGESTTCGLSGFTPGTPYPTVNLEKIQDRLMLLSMEMMQALTTKHPNLHEVLVPVSMALLNSYDDEYMGIISEEEAEQLRQREAEREAEAMKYAGLAPMGEASEAPAACGAQWEMGTDGSVTKTEGGGCNPEDCASCSDSGCADRKG